MLWNVFEMFFTILTYMLTHKMTETKLGQFHKSVDTNLDNFQVFVSCSVLWKTPWFDFKMALKTVYTAAQ